MAFVQVVLAPDITAEQYDQVIASAYGGKLDEGEIFHVAGKGAEGWWVIDGWDTREACDASMQRLMPALQEAGISMDEMPKEFEIHRFETRG